MRNKSYKYTIFILLIFTIMNVVLIGNVNAFEETEASPNVVYENWLKLLEDEKERYVEPSHFSIPYEKVEEKDNIDAMTNGLKAAYSERYCIDNMRVKDQGDTMQCWAFSTTSVIESNIEKMTNQKSPELSARHMDYSTTKSFLDGTNKNSYNRELKSGGNFFIAMGYCTSGRGPVLNEDMKFENNEDKIALAEISNKDIVAKVDEYVTFPTIVKEYTNDGKTLYTNGLTGNDKVYYSDSDINDIRERVKMHLIKYGALTSFTYAGTQDAIQYYNSEKVKSGLDYSYFCNKVDAVPDHAITIVGWDDTYSKENFSDNCKPSKDGAYIVLNSYGEDLFNNGYYYISYEDFLIEYSMCGVLKTSDVEYDNIYQHDYLGYSYMYNTKLNPMIANVFDRNNANENKENLTEVSFVTGKLTDVKIYVNGKSGDIAQSELVAELNDIEAGYHTYKLKTPIELTGDKFAVALKYTCDDTIAIPLELNFKSNNKGSNFWDTAKSNAGESMMSIDGNNWYDLSWLFKNANFCIKAFSEYEDNKDVKATSVVIDAESTIMNINDQIQLSTVIMPTNTTNKEIIWKSSDDKVATVSTTGLVKAISAGKVTITATNSISGKSDSIEINVSKEFVEVPVTKIFINSIKNKYEDGTSLEVGEKYTFKVSITPQNATNKNIKWSTSDSSIATIDVNGVITPLKEGKVTIKAINEASGLSYSMIINVLAKSSTNTPNNDNIPSTDKDVTVNVEDNTSSKDKITLNPSNDPTISTVAIPNAGIKYGIIILVVIVLGKLIFVAKKYINMRDIK